VPPERVLALVQQWALAREVVPAQDPGPAQERQPEWQPELELELALPD
jgi:hypothetical protein